jgi:hypothetical protein
VSELEKDYDIKIKDRWGECIFRHSIVTRDIGQYNDPKSGK